MFYIYSKNNCPYCSWAKDLLIKEGFEYREFNVQEDTTLLEQLTDKLGFKPKTVPQIWEDDTYVGGYTELVKYLGD